MRIKYPRKLEKVLLDVVKEEYSVAKDPYVTIESLSFDIDYAVIIEGRYGFKFGSDNDWKDYKFTLYVDSKINKNYLKGMFAEKINNIEENLDE